MKKQKPKGQPAEEAALADAMVAFIQKVHHHNPKKKQVEIEVEEGEEVRWPALLRLEMETFQKLMDICRHCNCCFEEVISKILNEGVPIAGLHEKLTKPPGDHGDQQRDERGFAE